MLEIELELRAALSGHGRLRESVSLRNRDEQEYLCVLTLDGAHVTSLLPFLGRFYTGVHTIGRESTPQTRRAPMLTPTQAKQDPCLWSRKLGERADLSIFPPVGSRPRQRLGLCTVAAFFFLHCPEFPRQSSTSRPLQPGWSDTRGAGLL